MGTRSVVAVQTGDDFKGRYIHWDGYPGGVGEQLLAIVKRDGAARAVQVLTEENYGWSNLDSDKEHGALTAGLDDGRFVIVKGYGIAYTTVQNQSSADDWITSGSDDWGTEWAYILRDHELVVLERTYGDTGAHATGWFGISHDNDSARWVVRGRVSYDAVSVEGALSVDA